MIIDNESKLIKIVEGLKAQDKTIITTNGVYDLIHDGHLDTLEKAKSYGDVLFVLINCDDSVKRQKGPKRPIRDQYARAKLMDSLKPVDYVYIFEEDTPLNLFKKIKQNIHVKGGSYIPERVVEEKTLIESWNGQCIYLPMIGQESTTNIIKKIIDVYSNDKNF